MSEALSMGMNNMRSIASARNKSPVIFFNNLPNIINMLQIIHCFEQKACAIPFFFKSGSSKQNQKYYLPYYSFLLRFFSLWNGVTCNKCWTWSQSNTLTNISFIIVQWQRSVKKESRGYTTGSSNALALSSSVDTPIMIKKKGNTQSATRQPSHSQCCNHVV